MQDVLSEAQNTFNDKEQLIYTDDYSIIPSDQIIFNILLSKKALLTIQTQGRGET